MGNRQGAPGAPASGQERQPPAGIAERSEAKLANLLMPCVPDPFRDGENPNAQERRPPAGIAERSEAKLP